MAIRSIIPPLHGHSLLVVTVALVCTASAAQAQDAVFADDFTQDSLSWTTQSFDGSGPASARGELGAIVMEASSVAGGNANRIMRMNVPTDSLAITASIDPTTTLTDADSLAYLSVDARLYNSLTDGGIESVNGNFYGDVSIGVSAGVAGDGNSGIFACVNRETETGSEPVAISADGNHCFDFDNLSVTVGTPITIGYAFDRATGVLSVTAEGRSETATLPSPYFASSFNETSIQLKAENEAPLTVARITSITTDSGSTDFSGSTPVVDRYEAFFFDSNNPGSASVINGRARMFAVSADGNYSATEVIPQQSTDYLEAVLTLSSESDLGVNDGVIDARLESEWFNNSQDGGFDGRTGDVRAILELRAQTDGRRSVQYCLIRSEDADFNNQSGILDDGRTCETFPTRIELDTPYRVSMALDREAATMSYRFEGFEHVQPISMGVFAPSRTPRGDARGSANNGASVVAYIDDLRTAPSALTSTESAAGIAAPATFPDPIDTTTLAADSTLSAPYDFEQRLNFIDDFSDPSSSALGFWGGARNGRGESGVRYVDGALELQANTNYSDDNSDNYSEFYINGRTDNLRARVSLSSDSTLPPDPRAEAEIVLRAVFHNDVQDGGPGGREGDISVRVLLRQEGDGRMRNGFGINRRNADGNTENYNIIDGNDFSSFELIPVLDTIYELGLQIDRERNVLIVSLDDNLQEIALPTQAFEASQAEVNIQVSHRGTSGRAVGRIHSIETDTFQRDFSEGPGVIGPYAPEFNSRNRGREITYVDGRARFLTDATLSSGSNTRLFMVGGSDFIGADVELSSESTIAAEGTIKVGVGASLYNDFIAGDGNEGRVYAEMWLSANADGTTFAEYCAFRSNDADFSDRIELIAGRDDDCARFDQPIAFDTPYTMSLHLDRENSALVYRVGTETREYAIATQILDITRPFNSVNLRASDDSIGIGFVDNVALAENPVPLADSDNQLVITQNNTGMGTDDNGSGENNSGDNGSSEGSPDDSSSGDNNSSSSSSGCSIAGTTSGGHVSLLGMLLFAIGGMIRRRFCFSGRKAKSG